MNKMSYLHSEQSEGRREALKWLARQLRWEQRLSELRPGAAVQKHAA